MVFIERLKNLRTTNGMTQLELSRVLEINERSYRALEIGQSKPKYETLIKLANYFNVSLDYLAGLSDNPKRNE